MSKDESRVPKIVHQEVTREEMLARLEKWRRAIVFNESEPLSWGQQDANLYQAIRCLIEQPGEPGVMTRVSGTPIKQKVSRNDFAQACDTVWQANLEQREFDFDEMVERVMNKLGYEVEK